MFWGYGPALDLLRELEKSRGADKGTPDEGAPRSSVGDVGVPEAAAAHGRTGTPAVPHGGRDGGALRGNTQHGVRISAGKVRRCIFSSG